MRLHATVSIASEIIEIFNARQLEQHFKQYDISMQGIANSSRFRNSKTKVSLAGTKEDIRKSIKDLYIISAKILIEADKALGNYKSKEDIDLSSRREKIPSEIRKQLEIIENDDAYNAKYHIMADKYMKHCALNDQMPHPEVMESYQY